MKWDKIVGACMWPAQQEKPWLSGNMLTNINTCEHGCSNLSSNLRVVAIKLLELIHTPSGRIGKVVASHLKVTRLPDRTPAVADLHRFILCTRRSGGTAHEGGWCHQSIGSTVSGAIVRSWLWSTATRSSPLGYFGRSLKVIDNWLHILW